jgi:uncharacterized protein
MWDRIVDGRTDLVFDWVASGNNAASTDSSGVSLMRWCAYYGDVSAIRFLVSHGEALRSLGDNFDLNGAAFHGHWRLCEFLIENGANPKAPQANTLETPLHAAASVANRPAHDLVVAVLVAAGADPNCATSPGIETGSFMRDCRTRGETPLHRAAAFGSETMIKTLLDAGGDIQCRDVHGDTPLSWASWHQRPSAILRLLAYGAHSIHPNANWTGDHGAGWRGMDHHLLGRPRV